MQVFFHVSQLLKFSLLPQLPQLPPASCLLPPTFLLWTQPKALSLQSRDVGEASRREGKGELLSALKIFIQKYCFCHDI
ncbi:MAG: hypothetical protein F6K41_38800 [Symploca sp. SIO3E6]|nr:hypothetical protein [Caldora sp. SIO3E6]